MRELGEVVAIEDGIAKVKFKRSSACGHCGACGILKDMSEIVIEVKNSLGASVGERVEVEFEESNSLKSAALAYLFPLIMLIMGVVLGYVIGSSGLLPIPTEIFAAILGIVFVIITWFILRLIDKKLKKRVASIYKMVQVFH